MIEIPVRFSGAGELPHYATEFSAGMDLRANIKAPITLNSQLWVTIIYEDLFIYNGQFGYCQ